MTAYPNRPAQPMQDRSWRRSGRMTQHPFEREQSRWHNSMMWVRWLWYRCARAWRESRWAPAADFHHCRSRLLAAQAYCPPRLNRNCPTARWGIALRRLAGPRASSQFGKRCGIN